MAWMSVFGPCHLCHRPFEFNAERVPSVVPIRCGDCGQIVIGAGYDAVGKPCPFGCGGRIEKGAREPLCQSCVERVNRARKARGFPEISILPGAYEAQEVDY